LDIQDNAQCRLCFTVQWPTDLKAVSRLSRRLGENLRIFLGPKKPVEPGSDVTPMLHSKVAFTDNGDGTCTAFVGSHNWTENALHGHNAEASLRIECKSSDPIAKAIRNHLDRCADDLRCVPFDPNDLDFYKTLQRELSSARPPRPDDEPVPGFRRIDDAPTVVIHAEGEEGQYHDPVWLFLPIRDETTAKWFRTIPQTTVLLFMYPSGTLFGHTPPSNRPILFHGRVGRNDLLADSPMHDTDITCEIRDLLHPVMVPSKKILRKDESYQVVVKLSRVGPAEIPIHHSDQPTVKLRVRFGAERDELEETEGDSQLPWPERVVRLRVPSHKLLHSTPVVKQLVQLWLQSRLLDRDAMAAARGQKQKDRQVTIDLKNKNGKYPYVYQASFVLDPAPTTM
jgi:hypothetical protein